MDLCLGGKALCLIWVIMCRSVTYTLPESAQQTTAQAIRATTKAWEDGVSQQKVELLLPLIGATDLDDWYEGVWSSRTLVWY